MFVGVMGIKMDLVHEFSFRAQLSTSPCSEIVFDSMAWVAAAAEKKNIERIKSVFNPMPEWYHF